MEESEPGEGILQVDLENAFNNADRNTFLTETELHYPECLRWVFFCFGVVTELVFGDIVISSSTGLHQGDPLAGQIFAQNLQPVVERIQQVPTLKANVWFHDDGNIAGDKTDLKKAVRIIKEDGPARGLFLSTSATVSPPTIPKSSVCYGKDPDPLQEGIPRVTESGIILLGSPIGDRAFTRKAIELKVEKIHDITFRLPLLEDAQTEFALLRSCLSLPKMMYVLRTVDPTDFLVLSKEYNSITREALGQIIGTPPTDQQWSQAKLPVSLGGLGLRAAADHGPAAFSTSILSSRPIVNNILGTTEDEATAVVLPSALLQLLSSKTGEEETTETLEAQTQKIVSRKIYVNNHGLLSSLLARQGEQREVARMFSLGLPHAGTWLNVVPSPSLGLNLRSLEFTTLVKYRLGINLYPREGPCPACSRQSN